MEWVEEEQYILLNFKEKVDQKFFTKQNLFFKIVNLTTPNPFVQIGPHVFRGKFEESFSTNLLFEEQSEPRTPSLYEKSTPIHLKYLAKTTKVLTLTWQKIPDEIIDVNTEDLVELEFTESYDTVLNKIENETLDIADIIKNSAAPKPSILLPPVQKSVVIPPPSPPPHEKEVEIIEPEEVETEKERVEAADDLLSKLASVQISPPEYYNKITDEDFDTNQQFLILKELYLKSLDHKTISLLTDDRGIETYVDVQASIADGIITSKKVDQLNDHDKQHLISLKNFDNLCIPMRLALLVEHCKVEKKAIGEMSVEELQVLDEFGRTPKERYRMLKSLAKDLQYYLFMCMRENKLSKDE